MMAYFISVLGMSGAGKSTHSDIFVKNNHRYVHLSMSKLLRAAVQDEFVSKPIRQEIEHSMTNGLLIEASLTWSIAKKALGKIGPSKIVLLDGYPRNIECLWQTLKDSHCLLGIVFLQISPKVMRRRRRLQIGRKDISEQAQKNRDAFLPEMEKVLRFFQDTGPVIRVDVNSSNIDLNQLKFARAINSIKVLDRVCLA